MSNPRKAGLEVIYNGKNISSKVTEFVKSFSYDDVASGESDAISLSFHDRSGKWTTSWFPEKGDKLSANITTENWKKDGDKEIFKCGSFILDDLSFGGPPIEMTIGAVSIPATEPFKVTKRTKTWKNITIKGIAQEVASRSKVSLSYSGSSVSIKEIEQNDVTDCEFLYQLCEDYGLAMKVYANKIVIFDEAIYENKNSVATIDYADMQEFSFNTTVTGTYTGAEMAYTDAKTENEIKVRVGSGSRIMQINEKAEGEADAELKACAKVNAANKQMTTLNFTIMANQKIIATSNVTITGMGRMNGKYAVDKVTHKLVDGKYTMTLQVRMIQKRITPKKKITIAPKPPEIKKSYNVGDIVTFKGGTHYISSYPGARGYSARAGKAKITIKNGSGKAHPWHLIHTDSGSNVYGWVDEGTFS